MLLSDIVYKKSQEANFARPKGAKDKKKRKRRSDAKETLKSGISGATTAAGLTWTTGEGLRAFPKKFPKAAKLGKKISARYVPKAAVGGLAVGLTLPTIRKLLRKRKNK